MDKQAFTEQITAMEGTLYSVARTFFASPHDCADAVQEAVLKAWRSRHTLRNPAFFKTWVVRILINQCKTTIRQAARMTPVADVPEPEPMPERDYALLDAVMALPILYRVPFVLHYVEGYTTREIGQILHIPKGTVLSRLQRARHQLKQSCGEEVYQA